MFVLNGFTFFFFAAPPVLLSARIRITQAPHKAIIEGIVFENQRFVLKFGDVFFERKEG